MMCDAGPGVAGACECYVMSLLLDRHLDYTASMRRFSRANVEHHSVVHTPLRPDLSNFQSNEGAPMLATSVGQRLCDTHDGSISKASRDQSSKVPHQAHSLATSSLQDELIKNMCRVKSIDVWQRGVDTEVFHPRFRSADMKARMSNGHPEAPLLLYVGRLGAGEPHDRKVTGKRRPLVKTVDC
eukprot:1136927-Pelagomonas_calceolata.AAC.4